MSIAVQANSSSRRLWLGAFIWIGGIAGFVFSIIVLILWFASSYFGFPVSGREFDPYSLSVRDFSYSKQFFFSDGMVRGIRRKPSASLFLADLVKNKLITPTTQQNRWDLIDDNLSGPGSEESKASLLFTLLDDWQFTESMEKWNVDYPVAAGFVWSEVIELSRSGDYELIPGLLYEVEKLDDEAAIKRVATRYLVDELTELVKSLETEPQGRDLKKYYEWIMRLDPENEFAAGRLESK